jgi:glyoxylase-like metal-dependent hydrolase (beta-lactamase superfamily II)
VSTEYEVIALRYGTSTSIRSKIFYRYHAYGDEEDTPIQTDYYLWVIRNDAETMLLDTGFSPDVGRRRGRTCLIDPVLALEEIGIQPTDVSRVILSHFHYDHVGNVSRFPRATYVAQARELAFWTSSVAKRHQFAAVIEPAEISFLESASKEGRLSVIDGDQQIAPGIEARLVGGHCPGQQLISVTTSSGVAVLASDALHFYEEVALDRPFDIFSDLSAMYTTYDVLSELGAREGTSVVAGHDPDAMTRFPALNDRVKELAVRIE